MRPSLLNIAGQRRQVRVKTGVVNLPAAVRVDIDCSIGATVSIVSDTNRSIEERLVVKCGDDARIIAVQ